MIRKFNAYMSELGVRKEDRLLLAVSGGVDSMVLWKLLLAEDYAFELAHVNFQLRGDESEQDQSFIAEKAREDQLKLHLKGVDTKSFAEKENISIQMAARRLRYAWFDELMQKQGFDYLLTAHHLDDAFETFLMNVDRGTGIKGLSGIHSTENKLRPLVHFSKEEIKQYAETEKILYREDASNADVKYKRNWFRHTIVQPWKEQNPSLLSTMRKNFDRWMEVDKLFHSALQEKSKTFEEDLNSGRMSIASVLDYEAPKSLLHHLLSTREFTESQLSDLYQCMLEKKVGSQFLSSICRITVDREYLFIENHIHEESGPYQIDHLPFSFQKDITLQLDLITFNQVESAVLGTEYIDLDKIEFPLILRTWKEGDSMQPLGMKGRKKISDILIDKKVPLPSKSNVWVLLSGSEIVCLLGFGISEVVKMRTSTKNVMSINTP